MLIKVSDAALSLTPNQLISYAINASVFDFGDGWLLTINQTGGKDYSSLYINGTLSVSYVNTSQYSFNMSRTTAFRNPQNGTVFHMDISNNAIQYLYKLGDAGTSARYTLGMTLSGSDYIYNSSDGRIFLFTSI